MSFFLFSWNWSIIRVVVLWLQMSYSRRSRYSPSPSPKRYRSISRSVSRSMSRSRFVPLSQLFFTFCWIVYIICVFSVIFMCFVLEAYAFLIWFAGAHLWRILGTICMWLDYHLGSRGENLRSILRRREKYVLDCPFLSWFVFLSSSNSVWYLLNDFNFADLGVLGDWCPSCSWSMDKRISWIWVCYQEIALFLKVVWLQWRR